MQLLYIIAFNSYATIKRRINKACNAIHNSWYTNCIQAANVYKVPLCRLEKRQNGGTSKSIRVSINKALTKVQEGAICNNIKRVDKINICARIQMIVGAANYLICFENYIVSYQ